MSYKLSNIWYFFINLFSFAIIVLYINLFSLILFFYIFIKIIFLLLFFNSLIFGAISSYNLLINCQILITFLAIYLNIIDLALVIEVKTVFCFFPTYKITTPLKI